MADGSYESIERLVIGDQVMAYDFAAKRRRAVPVTRMYRKTADAFLRLNGLTVTASHPFAVGPDEWRIAGDLKVGDRVIGNSFTTIERTERVARPIEVFNLSVGGPHTFYVHDGQNLYLVHNKL